jgi:Xaa-Pro aminopeptidase
MNDAQKLEKLRAEMVAEGVDAYLIPRTDAYQGEYVAANSERLAWLTGFTGSAGLGIVLEDKAIVMSDGRYTIQLSQQVDDTLYDLINSQETSPDEWLTENIKTENIIGYDPRLHTLKQIKDKEEQGLNLKPVPNLVDRIWSNRPPALSGDAFLFEEKFSGQSAKEKIAIIKNQLKEEGADGAIITLSDSIAWLLNIRGNDIPYIPVVLSYLFIPAVGKVHWFVNAEKIKNIKDKLSDLVNFYAEEKVEDYLKTLSGQKIIYDPKRSSVWFYSILKNTGADILESDDLCIMPRACKNETEQAAMKKAHIRDGVALVKFFKWFETANNRDELNVEKQLEEFRAEAPEFKEPSFNTIAGFGSHGAIVHYRADEKSNKVIEDGSLLLIDSGAQYEDGTTDITRTIAVGDPTDEMKERNTLVLKGHIALASAKFKKDTSAKELDKLARQYLQEKGLDYAHGTGHGVGCYLSVHEEAAKGISPRADEPLKAGMILSNEPGYYQEDEYGIRIENLILVKEDDEELYFETISFCPLDKNLIVTDMLNQKEINWLNDYHAQVFEKLSPYLDEQHKAWLKEKTAEISGGP